MRCEALPLSQTFADNNFECVLLSTALSSFCGNCASCLWSEKCSFTHLKPHGACPFWYSQQVILPITTKHQCVVLNAVSNAQSRMVDGLAT